MINTHPVATTTAGVSTIAGLVIWLLGHYGVAISAEDATAVVGAASTIIAVFGRSIKQFYRRTKS
jgi:hypothetical protein